MAITKIGKTFEELGFKDSIKARSKITDRDGYSYANDFIKKDFKNSVGESLKGAGVGGAVGAGIGSIIARRASGAKSGAAQGAILGSILGQVKGRYKTDKEILESKGLRHQKNLKGLLGYVEATPEAKERYLKE